MSRSTDQFQELLADPNFQALMYIMGYQRMNASQLMQEGEGGRRLSSEIGAAAFQHSNLRILRNIWETLRSASTLEMQRPGTARDRRGRENEGPRMRRIMQRIETNLQRMHGMNTDSQPMLGRNTNLQRPPMLGRNTDSQPMHGRNTDSQPMHGRNTNLQRPPMLGRNTDSQPMHGRNTNLQRPPMHGRNTNLQRPPMHGRNTNLQRPPMLGRNTNLQRPPMLGRNTDSQHHPMLGRTTDSQQHLIYNPTVEQTDPLVGSTGQHVPHWHENFVRDLYEDFVQHREEYFAQRQHNQEAQHLEDYVSENTEEQEDQRRKNSKRLSKQAGKKENSTKMQTKDQRDVEDWYGRIEKLVEEHKEEEVRRQLEDNDLAVKEEVARDHRMVRVQEFLQGQGLPNDEINQRLEKLDRVVNLERAIEVKEQDIEVWKRKRALMARFTPGEKEQCVKVIKLMGRITSVDRDRVYRLVPELEKNARIRLFEALSRMTSSQISRALSSVRLAEELTSGNSVRLSGTPNERVVEMLDILSRMASEDRTRTLDEWECVGAKVNCSTMQYQKPTLNAMPTFFGLEGMEREKMPPFFGLEGMERGKMELQKPTLNAMPPFFGREGMERGKMELQKPTLYAMPTFFGLEEMEREKMPTFFGLEGMEREKMPPFFGLEGMEREKMELQKPTLYAMRPFFDREGMERGKMERQKPTLYAMRPSQPGVKSWRYTHKNVASTENPEAIMQEKKIAWNTLSARQLLLVQEFIDKADVIKTRNWLDAHSKRIGEVLLVTGENQALYEKKANAGKLLNELMAEVMPVPIQVPGGQAVGFLTGLVSIIQLENNGKSVFKESTKTKLEGVKTELGEFERAKLSESVAAQREEFARIQREESATVNRGRVRYVVNRDEDSRILKLTKDSFEGINVKWNKSNGDINERAARRQLENARKKEELMKIPQADRTDDQTEFLLEQAEIFLQTRKSEGYRLQSEYNSKLKERESARASTLERLRKVLEQKGCSSEEIDNKLEKMKQIANAERAKEAELHEKALKEYDKESVDQVLEVFPQKKKEQYAKVIKLVSGMDNRSCSKVYEAMDIFEENNRAILLEALSKLTSPQISKALRILLVGEEKRQSVVKKLEKLSNMTSEERNSTLNKWQQAKENRVARKIMEMGRIEARKLQQQASESEGQDGVESKDPSRTVETPEAMMQANPSQPVPDRTRERLPIQNLLRNTETTRRVDASPTPTSPIHLLHLPRQFK